MAPMLKLHLTPMSESLLASVDETNQRCLIVRAALSGGRCRRPSIRHRTRSRHFGARGRRAVQNASTASVMAALINV